MIINISLQVILNYFCISSCALRTVPCPYILQFVKVELFVEIICLWGFWLFQIKVPLNFLLRGCNCFKSPCLWPLLLITLIEKRTEFRLNHFRFPRVACRLRFLRQRLSCFFFGLQSLLKDAIIRALDDIRAALTGIGV